jgi:hypothetical protein
MKSMQLGFAAAIVLAVVGCGGPEAPQAPEVGTASSALTATTTTRWYTVGLSIPPGPLMGSYPLIAGAQIQVQYANDEIGYGNNVYLHYGFNGWQSVTDVQMSPVGGGGFAPYQVGTLVVPTWATTLDYAVYALQANGTKVWDNNHGRDFHADVMPVLADAAASGSDVAVTYIGKLSPVKVHWGVNGWQSTTDTNMVKDTSVTFLNGLAKWTATLPGVAAQRVDMAFTNGSGGWDNNGNQNWFFKAGTATITILPSNLGSFYQPAVQGQQVIAYRNGTEVGRWPFVSATEQFRASGTGAMGDYKLVLDAIVSGTRYTGQATARVSTTTDVPMQINSAPWSQ